MNFWSDVYNAFSPFLSVPPEKLDAWYVPRPDRPLKNLVRELSPSKSPQKHILVGQPASGKSTEITKLAADLAKDAYALVVRFDLDQNLDIEKANPIDIIFLMGAAIYKAGEDVGAKLDQSRLQALSDAMKTLVETHTEHKGRGMDWGALLNATVRGLVVFAGAATAGPIGAAGAAAVLSAPLSTAARGMSPFRFSSGIETSLVHKQEVEPSVQRMIEALNAIIDDVTVMANRSPILLVDGLDKLRTPESIEANFLKNKFLRGPKCHALYAAPLDLYYEAAFAGVQRSMNFAANCKPSSRPECRRFLTPSAKPAAELTETTATPCCAMTSS